MFNVVSWMKEKLKERKRKWVYSNCYEWKVEHSGTEVRFERKYYRYWNINAFNGDSVEQKWVPSEETRLCRLRYTTTWEPLTEWEYKQK